MGIRVDGPKAWDAHLVSSWVITDEGKTHVVELRNGVLNQRVADAPAPGSVVFTLTRPTLIGLLTRTIDMIEALTTGLVQVDGDPMELAGLVELLDSPDTNFPIVTP